MGHQIIKQPDGKLAVFSSVVDEIVIAGATAEELAEYYADEAAATARERTKKITDAVLAGEPRKVYYQFAMTYDEAVEVHHRRGGPAEMIQS